MWKLPNSSKYRPQLLDSHLILRVTTRWLLSYEFPYRELHGRSGNQFCYTGSRLLCSPYCCSVNIDLRNITELLLADNSVPSESLWNCVPGKLLRVGIASTPWRQFSLRGTGYVLSLCSTDYVTALNTTDRAICDQYLTTGLVTKIPVMEFESTGTNKIMEPLRNWGIEFVCIGYIERTSVGNTECRSSICLHSVVLVLVHLWLW
jgi:hypothetical protein